MNMMFHELAKIRNGQSTLACTVGGVDHIFTPTKERRAYFQQRHPDKRFYVLGEPALVVDNTPPRRPRRRLKRRPDPDAAA